MTSGYPDPVWDAKYRAGHRQLYPWDMVVSFVFRHAPRDKPRSETAIIEVGCGSGANLWFAAREGFAVSGIDASAAAIESARARFAADGLLGDLRIGSFTSLPFAEASFDLAIDRGALTCASYADARRAVAEVHRVLRVGGLFLFNPYAASHTSAASGRRLSSGLVTDIAAGTLVGTGAVAFYEQADIMRALDERWRILALEHLDLAHLLPTPSTHHAEWRVLAERID